MDDLRPDYEPARAYAAEVSPEEAADGLPGAVELESVFDVPVRVQAVLGRAICRSGS